MKGRTILFLLALLGLRVEAEPELSGRPSELSRYLGDVQGTMSLRAVGKVEVEADEAVVSLSLNTVDKLFASALEKNRKARETAQRAMEVAGIPPEKISSSNFTSTPDYGRRGDVPKEYSVRVAFTVTIAQEKQLQVIAQLVDSLPEALYQGIEFKHSKEEENRKEALKRALEEINTKKRTFEQQLDVQLVPKHVGESPRKVYLLQAVKLFRTPDRERSQGGDRRQAERETTSSQFSRITYSNQVNVEYRMVPRQ